MTKDATKTQGEFTFHPLATDRWSDLETLFGARGACGGCWCMSWRLAPKDFRAGKGEGNRASLKELVNTGMPAGVIAYAGAAPAGWCAVAPRTQYPRLERSRVLARIDDAAPWSVTCLFVAKPFRRKGLMVGLLNAAANFAQEHGASLVEGYPIDTKGKEMPAPFVFTGLPSAFLAAGFKEVARRSAPRPIMRRVLHP